MKIWFRSWATSLLVSTALGALALTACLDESSLGRFDQADVLAFSVENEAALTVIDSLNHEIDVTLTEGEDLSHTRVLSITVSALATASVQPGDVLDLSSDYPLIVTAEDGTKVQWLIHGEARETGPDVGAGGQGGAGGMGCESYVANYQLTGTIETEGTPGGLGDAINTVGPGTMILRFVPSDPASAEVTVLSYDLPQQFLIEAPGARVTTDTHASAGPNDCGLAEGSFDGGRISWQSCDYGPAPPLGTTSWGADDVVGGPGCIRDFSVNGTVVCSGPFCSTSGVDFPITVDDLYFQPLNSFVFSDDLSTFAMRSEGAPAINASQVGVELPNNEPSRTFLTLDGTQLSLTCQALPVCGN